ncbi:MAG: MoaD/ThiS family protein [Planctomycetaceae bacterium]|nr:MoaD/ThiS family protein [Planctomycetaceae bacterium]
MIKSRNPIEEFPQTAMPITVHYETLLKRAAGTALDVVDLDGSCDLLSVAREVARRRGEPLQSLLFDDSGQLRPSVLIFVGDRQVSLSDGALLPTGAVVTLMSPISGG